MFRLRVYYNGMNTTLKRKLHELTKNWPENVWLWTFEQYELWTQTWDKYASHN